MNAEHDLKTDIIVTTLPIPQSELGHNWRVSVPVYDRGNRFSNDFETAGIKEAEAQKSKW